MTGEPHKKEETKKERIQRLLESRGLLFDHIRKFGCITRCHRELFQRLDRQLVSDGLVLDDLPPGDDCASHSSAAGSAEKVLELLDKCESDLKDIKEMMKEQNELRRK